MIAVEWRKIRAGAAIAGLALLAACATTPPPPPPPPPRPVVVIPPRPLPPAGAVASMYIPPRDAFGIRQTINANLTPAQKVWNLRSALNVAALNCLEPRHAGILANYTAFLKANAKTLSATNRALDAEFRQKYGATFSGVRDSYMTQVYNYFALPPALPDFCDAALVVSNETAGILPANLDSFAATALPRLEAVFDNFFLAFEQYRIDVSAWDSQYGAQYGITSAGYANPLAPDLAVGTPSVASGPLTLPPAPAPAPAMQQGPLVLPPVAAPSSTGPRPTPAATPGAVYGPSGRR